MGRRHGAATRHRGLGVVPVALLALALAGPARAGDELDLLVHWMTGSFSSGAQAAADSAYFDIRLHMAPIWPDDPSAAWLYVEQAAASRLEQPYRQRVYRVRRDGGEFTSEVWELPEPLRFVGAWRDPSLLGTLSPDSLTLREGCTVVMRREPGRSIVGGRPVVGAFVGGTFGTGCSSSLRGAAWATSEVRIDSDRITSWDRGFDENGNQVWGATDGPYVFLRLEESPPAPPTPPAPAPPAPAPPPAKEEGGRR